MLALIFSRQVAREVEVRVKPLIQGLVVDRTVLRWEGGVGKGGYVRESASCPPTAYLKSHELLLGDEVLEQEVLELEFFVQCSASFLEVFDFIVVSFIEFSVFSLNLLESPEQRFDSLCLILRFLLLTSVSTVQVEGEIFVLLDLLSETSLVVLLLLKFLLGAVNLAFFLEDFLHDLIALDDLFLHLREFLQEFLLLRTLLLLAFLLILQLSEKDYLFIFLESFVFLDLLHFHYVFLLDFRLLLVQLLL